MHAVYSKHKPQKYFENGGFNDVVSYMRRRKRVLIAYDFQWISHQKDVICNSHKES